MAINKFQRSRLTFQAVTQIGVPVFSDPTWPIKLKFHMKTPYDRLAKIFTNCSGYMTKMTAMPISGINPLKFFFSGTKKANGLQPGTWYVALGMLALPGSHK